MREEEKSPKTQFLPPMRICMFPFSWRAFKIAQYNSDPLRSATTDDCRWDFAVRFIWDCAVDRYVYGENQAVKKNDITRRSFELGRQHLIK